MLRPASRLGRRFPGLERLTRSLLVLLRPGRRAGHRARDELLRSLSELLAEDPVLRVEEFGGVFVLDPRSDLFKRLAVSGGYERELAGLALRLVDSERDVLDIGANVGFFSVLLAGQLGRASRVLAVEPTPSALRRLRENLRRNAVAGKVIVVEGVAGEKPGRSTLHVVPGREEYSSLGSFTHPSVVDSEFVDLEVRVHTIDELVERHGLNPGFVKMDVEGGEGAVLKGAVETIRAHRPVIISEASDVLLRQQGTSVSALVQGIRSLGYRVVDPLDPRRPAGARRFGDILCIPEESSQIKHLAAALEVSSPVGNAW